MRLNLRALWLLGFACAVAGSWINEARAQTMIVACPGAWGDNGGVTGSGLQKCTGCDTPIWTSADAADNVKTNASSNSWPKLGSLKSTDLIALAPAGAIEGAKADCSLITGAKTVAEVLGGTSPTPSPPTDPTPTPGSGTITLTWGAPLTNTDGSALTDLAGYRILFGTSASMLDQTVAIGSASVSTYTVTSLQAGVTYYFVLKSFNAAGNESQPTGVASAAAAAAPPSPIDCVVSDWSSWVLGTFGACVSGTQSRTDTRTRTIVTPAANGGSACPSLTDTRIVTQACTTAKTWKVAPNGTIATRPSYEAVLAPTGGALVRGNPEGTARVGAMCADEVFRSGTNSYRRVDEADLALTSPTYKGRAHVTICTQQ
ncbi:MAG TPA: fibronectin type III domain-containing protein [Burkholderiales bacterium]|nr:fibronectin type III domain-containing protein [Burkholderiales bacterium]